MNAKYAQKPKANPNEPNKANRLVATSRPESPLWGERSVSFSPATGRLHTFLSRHSFSDGGCHFPFPFFSGLFSLVSGLLTKRTQFFHDQICIINIKNAEMEAKNLPKKTKRTQLWITLSILSLPVLPAVSLSNRVYRSIEPSLSKCRRTGSSN